MKRSFLIPLVLVLLGILVPVVYTTTRGGEAHDPPSSASIDTAVEEEKAQGEVEKKQQDQEKEDEVSGDEEKEQQKSAETAVSNKESSNKGSQSKQGAKESQDNKSAETKRPTGQSSSSSQGKKQDTSGKTSPPEKKDDGPKSGYIRVTLTIVGKNGNIMYNSAKVDVKEKETVLDALYATGVSCKVRSDGYVRAISGLAENPNTGEGWMYSINGGSPPGVGAASYTVKSGDRIIWFYGKIGDPPPKV